MLSLSSMFTYYPSIELPAGSVDRLRALRVWMLRCSAGVSGIVCVLGGWCIGPILVWGRLGRMGQDRTDKDRTGAEPQRERAWARWRSGHLGCRPGLQLGYSTRRAVLAHDVTLGWGWAIGLSACLPVLLSPARLTLPELW